MIVWGGVRERVCECEKGKGEIGERGGGEGNIWREGIGEKRKE